MAGQKCAGESATRRVAENSLIDHDDRVIPERTPPIMEKQLEWAARKAAGSALKPDDVLLDVEVGNLRRFRDNGIDKPVVTPKKWARAIPAARGIMTVTYTLEQVLFLSDGRAVNCALTRIHRAQPLTDQHQFFAFAGRSSQLVLLELESASRRANAQPGGFLDRLLAARDGERAKLPAKFQQELERIDAIVQAQSIEALWVRPAAPAGMTPEDVDQLAGLGVAAAQEDGIDEATWNRLRLLARAASREDAAAYAETMMWAPPDFGLSGQHRTGVYLLYLLGFRVKEVLQTNKPTADQLHDLAGLTYPRFRAVLDRADETHLEETLRTALEMPPLGKGISPGEFTVFAAAALGLLLDDPDIELAAIRHRLASWWERHRESFVRQGRKE
jgi:hypothetical protein